MYAYHEARTAASIVDSTAVPRISVACKGLSHVSSQPLVKHKVIVLCVVVVAGKFRNLHKTDVFALAIPKRTTLSWYSFSFCSTLAIASNDKSSIGSYYQSAQLYPAWKLTRHILWHRQPYTVVQDLLGDCM
jgi:hypothetical protein